MKKLFYESVFPKGLSDEAAWALHECLQALVATCESRYLSQLTIMECQRLLNG